VQKPTEPSKTTETVKEGQKPETPKEPVKEPPKERPKEQPKETPKPITAPADADKLVKEALELRDEFYRKRLLQNEFDYELLVKAIEIMKAAKNAIREGLEKSPSDEKLRDLSSRIEPELAKLNEEKIAYDLEKKSEKETEEILKRGGTEGKKETEKK